MIHRFWIFYVCKHNKNCFQEIYCALLEVKLKSTVDVQVQEMGFSDFIQNKGKCHSRIVDEHCRWHLINLEYSSVPTMYTATKDPRGAFQRVLIILGLLESMSEVLEPVFIQMKNFQRKIVMRTSSCESQWCFDNYNILNSARNRWDPASKFQILLSKSQ